MYPVLDPLYLSEKIQQRAVLNFKYCESIQTTEEFCIKFGS